MLLLIVHTYTHNASMVDEIHKVERGNASIHTISFFIERTQWPGA